MLLVYLNRERIIINYSVIQLERVFLSTSKLNESNIFSQNYRIEFFRKKFRRGRKKTEINNDDNLIHRGPRSKRSKPKENLFFSNKGARHFEIFCTYGHFTENDHRWTSCVGFLIYFYPDSTFIFLLLHRSSVNLLFSKKIKHPPFSIIPHIFLFSSLRIVKSADTNISILGQNSSNFLN